MTDEDFDSFENFLANWDPTKQGHRIANILRYRQGSDVSDWAAGGLVKYIPAAWFLQVGAARWTGGASLTGVIELTFPAPYLDGPVVLATPTDTTPLFQTVRVLASLPNPAGLEIYWKSDVNLTAITVAWLAIGPART